MKTSIIVAMGTNNVIGIDNQLPWHLSADLKYFKATTMGKPILMGRKTFESIGRPLPGRTNIVMTRDQSWSADGVSVVHDIEAAKAVAMADGADELMIIGGAEIYKQTLASADRLYVTEVTLAPKGDAYFPEIDDTWHETKREPYPAIGDDPAYAFVIYER